ncbi:prepilin peptidase [Bacillus luteolus]|uniref:Prepilin peptidase n=1 Tax=Litchfieldia luteola TaxID=682179 RepID=A0ABR9QLH6_9BACI|nr:prepilin peptidase [Cytobacillus luteolus]MBE4909294.1 prepilin peptidase [Cytobacillus luteolus]MBP1940688.1 prepilin peptidase CpaA [Cytobacillus luteolus]
MIMNSLLIVVLGICLLTDLKSRRIYNKVIFPALGVTFIIHAFSPIGTGIIFSVLGFLTGLGILIIPYMLGGMGAGDVKLLALIGAIKGSVFVFYTGIYMALIGGIIALGILFFRKGVLTRLKSILYSIVGLKNGVRIPLTLDKDALQATYPYGVAIVGGALLSLFAKGWILL